MSISNFKNNDVAIIQPFVPHYRKKFFQKLSQKINFDLYVYQDVEYLSTNGFYTSDFPVFYLKKICIGKLILYNIFPLLKKYNTIILCGELKLITNWLIIIYSRIFGVKIIVWGHGIRVQKYNQEQIHTSKFMKLMYKFSDLAWFYTESEKIMWTNRIPNLKSISLNNTIEYFSFNKIFTSTQLVEIKKRNKIYTEINLIFCARFNSNIRRIDLLNRLIQSLDAKKFGLIVIGDGKYKSDLIKSKNVYDFGSVYDDLIKSELFSIADIYFQPAGCGLSVVEAMAYGKPVFTIERRCDIVQGVEYGYIKDELNGKIFHNIDEITNYLNNSSKFKIQTLGFGAKNYYDNNLSMNKMVDTAINSFKLLERI
ncbi:MAG: glycosyltransferase [Desulfomicrobium sp.]